MARHTLGETMTSNASFPSAGLTWKGGKGTLDVIGAFDTATATLQTSINGGTTWVTVGSDTTFTTAGVGNFELGGGDRSGSNTRKIRITISSVGASTDLDAFVTEI